jgi:hypothetical protein
MREHRVWCMICNLVVHGRHRPTYGTKTFHGHIRFHNIHTRLRPDDLTMFAVSRTNQFTEMMFASEESWHVLTRASPMWRARAWTTTRFPLYAVAPVSRVRAASSFFIFITPPQRAFQTAHHPLQLPYRTYNGSYYSWKEDSQLRQHRCIR